MSTHNAYVVLRKRIEPPIQTHARLVMGLPAAEKLRDQWEAELNPSREVTSIESVSGCIHGVLYSEWIAGCEGASFRLWCWPEHRKKARAARQYLRDTRDVVRIETSQLEHA